MTLVESLAEAPYTVLGWRVHDIAETIAELQAAGVRFNRYDGMDQDADGVWVAPGGTRVAWFSDPDGNTLSAPTGARQLTPTYPLLSQVIDQIIGAPGFEPGPPAPKAETARASSVGRELQSPGNTGDPSIMPTQRCRQLVAAMF